MGTVAETPLMAWSLGLNELSWSWLKMKPWQLLVLSTRCSFIHLVCR